MSFWTKKLYNGPALEVYVSTTYDGSSAPVKSEWTKLPVTLASGNTWEQSTAVLEAYKGANVHVAFVYTSSTTDGAALWNLDDFEVSNVDNIFVATNTELKFDYTAAGSTSEAKTFTFSAYGYAGNVVVTAPTGFELSKDNTDFSQSLTYTNTEAAAENTVYVRFNPATAGIFSAPIAFTSGTELTEQRGVLSGSSLSKENTLDIVTWNVEWFGSTGNGPSDEDLQYENVKQAITELDADILALQEVVDDAKIRELAQELGYSVQNLTPSWVNSSEQKTYYLYKPSVVTVKKEKMLLSGLYADILAGTTTLPNYPDDNSRLLWSSGRLPYLVQFEANINGVKQTYNVVNIHAKANDGEDMVQYNRRKYDVQVLKDSLGAQYGNMNLVVLGDYNDDVDMSVVGTGNPSTYAAFVTDNNYNALTYALSEADAATYESGSFRSFLDHIIISSTLEDEYVESSIMIESHLLNRISNFRSTTSDHLPVSARFELSAVPTVAFKEVSATRTEAAGSYVVNFTLSEAQATEQTFSVALTSESTATTEDFTIDGMSGNVVTVTVPANSTSASFTINIIDDEEVEETEVAIFRISSTTANLQAGADNIFALTIEDNDAAPTGIADATKGQFKLYPNPASSFVKLILPEQVASLPSINLAVYSVDGRLLLNATGSQEKVQQQLNDNVAMFTQGLYIIKVKTDKQVFLTRLIKQ
ncbi:endonuclease/exonuclease/phosphatase family protein [Pontibacter harenae]|uniref:endonuclease/exonuclease/phosphatase family protein n=1 Tax=Pontibacter harenae TaxID=2894083 RepID=UPI001E442BFF|nr:endonuclease/exonuclease/phosphatase family protein [Pontibacter harenae]MCC9168505.1 T9SS type A sorting domain-containing protein [Pontibacter harenae]